MTHKLLITFIVTAVCTTFILAQTPEPKGERASQVTGRVISDRSYLGVQTEEITRENFAKFGLREVRGVAVEKVIENSPAATAGIQAGDVIVRFNGEEITSSRKLTRLIGEVSPDHAAKITVVRGGSEREINVTMGKRPFPTIDDTGFEFGFPRGFPQAQMPSIPPMTGLPRVPMTSPIPGIPYENFAWRLGPNRYVGVTLSPLTKQLAEHFGVEAGSLITEVRENSPAAKAGLKAGDVIVEVEGKAVKDDRDIIRAITEKAQGDVTFTIVRSGSRQTVKVTPGEAKDGSNTFEFDSPDKVDLLPATPGTMPVPAPDQFVLRKRVI